MAHNSLRQEVEEMIMEFRENTHQNSGEYTVPLFLGGYDFSGLDLSGIDLEGVYLYKTSLRGSILTGANLTRCQICETDISHTILIYTNFTHANLNGSKFDRATFKDTIFSSALLKNTSFENVYLQNAHFDSANLYRASFRDSTLFNVDFHNAKLCQADFTNAVFSDVSTLGADLSGAKGLKPQSEIMNTLERDEYGYIVYKLFGWIYLPAPDWGIYPGSVIRENLCSERGAACGCGINVGTLEYAVKIGSRYVKPRTTLWKARIPYGTGFVVPYSSKGDIRAEEIVLIEEVRWEDILPNQKGE